MTDFLGSAGLDPKPTWSRAVIQLDLDLEQSKKRRRAAILSDEVCSTAGLAPDAMTTREVSIRGRGKPMMIRLADHASTLSVAVA